MEADRFDRPRSREDLIRSAAALTAALVRTDTRQPEGCEDRLVRQIDALFPESVFRRRIDHGAGRSSLILRIDGQTREEALAFVGHTDTVACGRLADWKHPPLEGRCEDGVLYGRGSADMKSGVAAMILAAQYLLASGKRPRHDVFFCFTADEEAAGTGVQAVMATGLLDQVRQVIIPEPTALRAGICEKGALWLRAEAHGALAHGSQPQNGVNGIDALIRFTQELRSAICTGEAHPLLGETTLALTRLSGGVMTNVIPADAEAEMDIRTLPGLSNERVLALARGIAAELSAAQPPLTIRLSVLNDRDAAETAPDAPLVRRMQAVLAAEGLDSAVRGLPYYTDMSQIAKRIDAAFLLLGPGDDAQAHQTDEHVRAADVETAVRVFLAYLDRWEL
ncbi:MAG: M20 family metallopeptidase [Oscillospiraceae bacterium]